LGEPQDLDEFPEEEFEEEKTSGMILEMASMNQEKCALLKNSRSELS
jgi:hypothetical protein